MFVSVYEPVAFAFLSCLQLLKLKGKKTLTKAVVIAICISVAYSAVFAIEFITSQAKHNFSELLVCVQVYTSNQQIQTISVQSSTFIPV